VLKPLLAEHERLEVDLDGTAGYCTGFLEEAFGGLIRETGDPTLVHRIIISSSEDDFKQEAESYMQDAVNALASEKIQRGT